MGLPTTHVGPDTATVVIALGSAARYNTDCSAGLSPGDSQPACKH